MHDHKSHSHPHGHHHHDHDHDHALAFTKGHNRQDAPSQWQMPHLPESHVPPVSDRERDLDLVETSFLEGFKATKDVTSFLRLARIPFVGIAPDGQRLHLLRVETTANADVGSVTPMLGGGAVLYDPLPAHLVSHRKALAFVYHDGHSQLHLTFAEARRLEDDSGASRIDFPSAETPDR